MCVNRRLLRDGDRLPISGVMKHTKVERTVLLLNMHLMLARICNTLYFIYSLNVVCVHFIYDETRTHIELIKAY